MNPNTQNSPNTIARSVTICFWHVWGRSCLRPHRRMRSPIGMRMSVKQQSRRALLHGNDPAESRMYAMMHVAIHDALNAIDRRSRPYAFDAQVNAGASREAAVASAARNVLVPVISQLPFPPACLQAGIASVEADYAAALAAIPDGAAKTQGIQVGQASAAAIVALRAGDGSDTPLLDFRTRRARILASFASRPASISHSRRDGAMSLHLCSTTPRSSVRVLRTGEQQEVRSRLQRGKGIRR